MSLKLKNATKLTLETAIEDTEDLIEWEEVRTERSAKLGRMIVHFSQPEKHFFSTDELSHLRITIICLPSVDMLLSIEGPFQPHSTFGPIIPIGTEEMNLSFPRKGVIGNTLSVLHSVAGDLYEKGVNRSGHMLNYLWLRVE